MLVIVPARLIRVSRYLAMSFYSSGYIGRHALPYLGISCGTLHALRTKGQIVWCRHIITETAILVLVHEFFFLFRGA
jgi:hypothetical protein